MNIDHPARERLLRRREVLTKTGLSASTLYRRIQAGTFPPPVELGPKAVAWRESEVLAWIASRPVRTKFGSK